MTPPAPEEIEGLIARLEGASGADRALDAQIVAAITPGVVGIDYSPVLSEDWTNRLYLYEPARSWPDSWLPVPAYTSSLDAALTLVPEGWQVSQLGEWDAAVLRERGPWLCIVAPRGDRGPLNPCWDTRCDHAPTPALALCIATLRALLSASRTEGVS